MSYRDEETESYVSLTDFDEPYCAVNEYYNRSRGSRMANDDDFYEFAEDYLDMLEDAERGRDIEEEDEDDEIYEDFESLADKIQAAKRAHKDPEKRIENFISNLHQDSCPTLGNESIEEKRKRYRRIIWKTGPKGLSERELAEYLLFPFVGRDDPARLADELLKKFRTLNNALNQPERVLMEVEGMTNNAAFCLSLYKEYIAQAEYGEKLKVKKLHDTARQITYCQGLIRNEKVEVNYVIALSDNKELLGSTLIGRGTPISADVDYRRIVEFALDKNARSVVICHNHPTGSIEPSYADVSTTESLLTLLYGLHVVIDDHIIISPTGAFSFQEHGLMSHLAMRSLGRPWSKTKLAEQMLDTLEPELENDEQPILLFEKHQQPKSKSC